MSQPQTAFNADLEDCIDNCAECHRVCVETMQYCLRMGGKHADLAHIRLLNDCVQICQVNAEFLIRDSELQGETCAACAKICSRCAEVCAAFGPDDDQMQECAQVCSRCAESSDRMAGE